MGKIELEDEQEMLKTARKKLDWYIHEASDEEYDENTVRALIDLLRATNSVGNDEELFTPDKALYRFWKSYEMRGKIENEFEKLKAGEVSLADYSDDEDDVKCIAVENDSGSYKSKSKRFFCRMRTMSVPRVVVAAALVVAVLFGGTAGVYAEKNGFFHSLKSNRDKSLVITDMSFNQNFSEKNRYYSLEDIPIIYLPYIWSPSLSNDNLEFKYIEINCESDTVKTKCFYKNDEEKKFINFTRKEFLLSETLIDTQIDSFEIYQTCEMNDVEITFFIKENDDYTEYICMYQLGKAIYLINSNLDYDFIYNVVVKELKKF